MGDHEHAWKGLSREQVVEWMAVRVGPGTANAVVDQLGLRCIGWLHWTGDVATSTPGFMFDELDVGRAGASRSGS